MPTSTCRFFVVWRLAMSIAPSAIPFQTEDEPSRNHGSTDSSFDAAPSPIHRFFASLPPLLRERGLPHQLLVTTSYDLALEAAFLDAGEEFDVVSYIAAGPQRGKFCHLRPDGTGRVVDLPNTYATELSL